MMGWETEALSTRASVLEVLKVFEVIGQLNNQSKLNKAFNFILTEKESFRNSYQNPNPTDCRTQIDSPFCRFMKNIRCDKKTYKYVYQWLRWTDSVLFPQEEWKDPKPPNSMRAKELGRKNTSIPEEESRPLNSLPNVPGL